MSESPQNPGNSSEKKFQPPWDQAFAAVDSRFGPPPLVSEIPQNKIDQPSVEGTEAPAASGESVLPDWLTDDEDDGLGLNRSASGTNPSPTASSERPPDWLTESDDEAVEGQPPNADLTQNGLQQDQSRPAASDKVSAGQTNDAPRPLRRLKDYLNAGPEDTDTEQSGRTQPPPVPFNPFGPYGNKDEGVAEGQLTTSKPPLDNIASDSNAASQVGLRDRFNRFLGRFGKRQNQDTSMNTAKSGVDTSATTVEPFEGVQFANEGQTPAASADSPAGETPAVAPENSDDVGVMTSPVTESKERYKVTDEELSEAFRPGAVIGDKESVEAHMQVGSSADTLLETDSIAELPEEVVAQIPDEKQKLAISVWERIKGVDYKSVAKQTVNELKYRYGAFMLTKEGRADANDLAFYLGAAAGAGLNVAGGGTGIGPTVAKVVVPLAFEQCSKILYEYSVQVQKEIESIPGKDRTNEIEILGKLNNFNQLATKKLHKFMWGLAVGSAYTSLFEAGKNVAESVVHAVTNTAVGVELPLSIPHADATATVGVDTTPIVSATPLPTEIAGASPVADATVIPTEVPTSGDISGASSGISVDGSSPTPSPVVVGGVDVSSVQPVATPDIPAVPGEIPGDAPATPPVALETPVSVLAGEPISTPSPPEPVQTPIVSSTPDISSTPEVGVSADTPDLVQTPIVSNTPDGSSTPVIPVESTVSVDAPTPPQGNPEVLVNGQGEITGGTGGSGTEQVVTTENYVAASVGKHLDLTTTAVDNALSQSGIDVSSVSDEMKEQLRLAAQHALERHANDVAHSGVPIDGFETAFNASLSPELSQSLTQSVADILKEQQHTMLESMINNIPDNAWHEAVMKGGSHFGQMLAENGYTEFSWGPQAAETLAAHISVNYEDLQTIWAQYHQGVEFPIKSPYELKQLAELAKGGDTAAMKKLLDVLRLIPANQSLKIVNPEKVADILSLIKL